MKRSTSALGLAAVALVGAALGAAGHALWLRHGAAPGASGQGARTEQAAPATGERRVLYWYDPMVPQQRFDKPGKSPFMDMELVPKYADEADAGGTVRIAPQVTQNLGVRLATVEKGLLARGVEAVGTVRFDETRIHVVQSRVEGYVEQQPVRSLNQPVAKGALLLAITSPALIAGQHELLLASKAGDPALADAARQRLTLGGMSADQVARVEATGKVIERVALTAPEAGIVTELAARPGMTVMPGAPLMSVSGLGSVWVVADVPERDAATVSAGRRAEVRFAALPGRAFEGRVDYVYPEIEGSTRTLRARIPLANARGELRPGMLAQVSLGTADRRQRLLVPSEAVIATGRRSVVIVAAGDGQFAPAEVRTGAADGGRTEILAGLEAGQKVVVSGQFLIDSEASLTSALARLESQPPPVAAAVQDCPPHGAPGHDHAHDHRPECTQPAPLAQGTVDEVDAAAGRIKLTHGPIPSVGMPGMTMGFRADPALLKGIAPGQTVEFDVEKRGGDYVVTRLQPRAPERKP
jgi:Cu(I)/Ag(I) efflux system membrane fusion protein